MNGSGRGVGLIEGEAVDAVPERCQYRDEGCELASSCLRCPFPRCRYDEPGGVAAAVRTDRDAEMVRLRRERRMAIAELARRFGVSKRSVHRILRRGGA